MPSAIVTGAPVPCSYSQCPHGGTIQIGDSKVWGPRLGGGIYFHAACVEPAARERELKEAKEREITPAPVFTHPAPVIAPPPVVPSPAVPSTPANLGDAAGKLAEAMAIIAGASRPALDRESVEAIVRDTLEAVKDSYGVRRITVEYRDRPAVDCGVQHRLFPRLLDLMVRGASCYIHGPAGTGKTQAAIEAAKALGLPFAVISMSPTTPGSKLEGYMDAHGRYVESDFYRMFSSGGVFIVDEMDNMSASVVTTLNSALANGVASFPCGTVERHKDFILIGTGNTTGRGPTAQYPERRKLDSATLSRLFFLHWPADDSLELALAAAHAGDRTAQAQRWARWVQAVREYIHRPDCGITATVYADMRAIISGARDIASPCEWMSVPDMAENLVFKGLPADQSSRILAAVPLPQGVL